MGRIHSMHNQNYQSFQIKSKLITYICKGDTSSILLWRGRHGRDRMVVGFTTTYAISAYHH
jgi:hypothetical protein